MSKTKEEIEEEKLFVLCQCGSEILLAQTFDWTITGKPNEAQIALSIYSHGYDGSKLSFKDRVKYCWYILTKGKLYHDNIIIQEKDLKQLKEKIIDVEDYIASKSKK